ncbi:nucleotidyltransferase domain-containing protein [Pseudanabaena minima]|uniref:nucleotidyltransferase domain-containing protein n=1 Tax=Pseudanabaena minima TaxID=890415 RepID=UPI003DA7F45A
MGGASRRPSLPLDHYPKNIGDMMKTIENKQLSDLLIELKARLVELYGDRLFSLILFGSQARGEATSDSDIDVMTVLDDPVNVAEEIYRMSDIGWHFMDKYGELVSIIPTAKSAFLDSAISFIRVVKREGIEI